MHSACVTRQVGHCEAELHAAAEAESARSQAEGLYNRNLVVQALTLTLTLTLTLRLTLRLTLTLTLALTSSCRRSR